MDDKSVAPGEESRIGEGELATGVRVARKETLLLLGGSVERTTLKILRVDGDRVTLGINAPESVVIRRPDWAGASRSWGSQDTGHRDKSETDP